ncbi:MAG: hypothetical protein PUB21_10545 [Bacteroidales bacterium]|nr:hypothetical protein [Bacteroidales bacterium]
MRNLFIQALNRLEEENAGNPLSDLFVQVDQQNGEVSIFDDTENLLGKEVVFDWVLPDMEEEKFDAKVTGDLKEVVNGLNEKGAFDKIYVVKPFSVSLVNDDFGVIEELLFLDDEMTKLDDELLKDMDKELDDFLKKLLSDME